MGEPIVTFTSHAGWYGLRASDILEVADLGPVRSVPRAPGIIAGLAEVHGRVVTLIDLDRMLSEEPAPEALSRFGVVLAPPREHLGILVRSDIDVAPGDERASRPEPEERGGLLLARLPVGDRLLNLLFLPAVVTRVEEAIRAVFRLGPGRPGGEA
jgi:chemotaxis signal transduction protein